MGFYGEQVVPRIVNVSCGSKALRPLRRRVCDGLHGDVVEVGFGTGLNVPYYPPGVTRVAAVEPADLCWRLAGDRLRASGVAVERSGLDGQLLPFTDASYDTALSTFALCTIPDVAAALNEVHRVLKPGGTLHFMEHGLAPDESVRRWQRRLDPVERALFGGCHLDRPILHLVTAGGFEIVEVETFYAKGSPKFGGAFSLGVAQAV